MPQDEETLALINLLQDFDKNAAAYEGLVTLDLVGLVDTLKIHNSDFTTLQDRHQVRSRSRRFGLFSLEDGRIRENGVAEILWECGK